MHCLLPVLKEDVKAGTMREMRQERWRKRRRIAHRAVTAKATNPYTDPVTIPNSRYLRIEEGFRVRV